MYQHPEVLPTVRELPFLDLPRLALGTKCH